MNQRLNRVYVAGQEFSETIFNRFWKKIKQSKSCWNWKGGKDKNGYGRICTGLTPPRNEEAHRVSWMIHFGDIPKGMHVLHKCDRPECVNPAHLFLGSHQENMHDMHKKKRGNMNKLSDETIVEIQGLIYSGASVSTTAKKTNVSKRVIYKYFKAGTIHRAATLS